MTAKLNRAFAPVLGAMALSLAPHLYAAPCEVASDPAGDSLQPLLDIVSVSMETSNGRLITVVELSTDAMLGSGLSDVSVNFNERRFVRAFLDAPTLYAYDYGAYESDGTTVSRTSEGDAEGSVNGAGMINSTFRSSRVPSWVARSTWGSLAQSSRLIEANLRMSEVTGPVSGGAA